jgi:hypothetical protein
MRNIGKLAAVLAVGSAVTLSSGTAFAKPGFMTCQVADSEKGHVFFSEKAFAADSAVADKALDFYLKALLSEKVPLLKSVEHAKGICNWEETRAEANKKTALYVTTFIKQGYLTYSDDHMPDPYTP